MVARVLAHVKLRYGLPDPAESEGRECDRRFPGGGGLLLSGGDTAEVNESSNQRLIMGVCGAYGIADGIAPRLCGTVTEDSLMRVTALQT